VTAGAPPRPLVIGGRMDDSSESEMEGARHVAGSGGGCMLVERVTSRHRTIFVKTGCQFQF
jgi:hypothetical protein